jgi:hypothetical protein
MMVLVVYRIDLTCSRFINTTFLLAQLPTKSESNLGSKIPSVDTVNDRPKMALVQ